MKKLIYFFLIISFFSCKKDKEEIKTSGSIQVINGVVNIPSIKVNFTGKKINFATTTNIVNYGASKIFYTQSGLQNLVAVSTIDTTLVLFNNSYNIKSGFYTLYISGQMPTPDTLFYKEDSFPYIKTDVSIPPPTDNVVNLRFVNLCTNSPILKINLKGSINNELEQLKYKQVSNWKAYINNASSTTNYIFEIRNAETGILLLSYTFGATSTNRYKNVSLIIKGLVGTTTGTNAFGIFPVNYF